MLPPSTRPSATGSTGCRAPERAKKTSIQSDGERGQRRSRSPSRSRRGRRRSRSSARGGSRTARRSATSSPSVERAARRPASSAGRRRPRRPRPRRAPSHCAGPPPSERSATEIGAQRVRRRADADVERRRRARAGSVTALSLRRVVDAERRPRHRLEPLDRDLLAAAPRRCRTCPSSIRASAASISREQLLARPPRAPRRARGRRSRWPCRARWLSALDDISSPVSSVERRRSRCRGARSCSAARSRSLEQRARKRSVSMLTRVSCPPAWRAVARSRPASMPGQLDDLVSRAAARNERDARRAERERLGEQREHGLVRACRARAARRRAPSTRRRAGRRPRRGAAPGDDAQPQSCRRRAHAASRIRACSASIEPAAISPVDSPTRLALVDRPPRRGCRARSASSDLIRRSSVVERAPARRRPRRGSRAPRRAPRRRSCSASRARLLLAARCDGALGGDERRRGAAPRARCGARGRPRAARPCRRGRRARARRPRSSRRSPSSSRSTTRALVAEEAAARAGCGGSRRV